jgi:NAD(P)-dependent dehydrogenase (short-subunit alcohol dehydrogenase family)
MAGRVAFVTDGWYRTGSAIADYLLADGATVAPGFTKPDPALVEFAAAHTNDSLTLHRGSMGVAEDCHRAVQDVIDRHGRLDVLVARELTRELAREVAGAGVTVNRVQAGLVDEELLSELPAGVAVRAFSKIPVRRFGERAEVARAVGFLAHPDSGYLTGQSLAVDGGLTLESI